MGYVSRIQPRERKVRAGDLDELPALSFNGDKENSKLRKHDIALWNKYISITPKEFTDIIQSWFYVDLNVDVQLDKKGLMTVNLSSPSNVFLESFFSADLEKKEFSKKSTIRLISNNEGKGLANAWFACQVELYAALGAEEIKHEATLTGGARKWARMGMYIDLEATHPKKIARTSRNLKTKLDAFYKMGAIDEKKYHEMLPYTDLKNQDDLVRLMSHDFIIPESVASSKGVHIENDFMKALECAISTNFKGVEPATIVISAEEQAVQLVQIWNRANPHCRSIPFSQFGLFRGEYNAIVRFDDVDQMQQVAQCVRGWKFGEVTGP